MGYRHKRLKAQELNTSEGVVKLDSEGTVTNEEDFEEGALESIPNLFYDERAEAKPNSESQDNKGKESSSKEHSAEDYTAVIREMMSDKENLNTEGYVDMEKLSLALSEKGMSKISGGERKKIQDAIKAETN